MLCAMAHSTQRGRAALGAADGAGVLLGLLRDPPYQVCYSMAQQQLQDSRDQGCSWVMPTAPGGGPPALFGPPGDQL
jgi:hypothetical protein